MNSVLWLWLACTPLEKEIPKPAIPSSIRIPAGTYTIGPPQNTPIKYATHRKVRLTYDLAVMSTEVTYADWTAVQTQLPNQFCTDTFQPQPLYIDQPVRCVSWCQAIAFANAKSKLEGLQPAYSWEHHLFKETDTITCNEEAQFVRLNKRANGWRLPTEAEWEIASGMPTTIPTSETAWFIENAESTPQPVAQFPANSWGLYDMQGNVFEWIWERFARHHTKSVTDPFDYEVPIYEVYTRPIKGGSFASGADALLPYKRANASPSLQHEAIGFRLVRTLTPPKTP